MGLLLEIGVEMIYSLNFIYLPFPYKLLERYLKLEIKN